MYISDVFHVDCVEMFIWCVCATCPSSTCMNWHIIPIGPDSMLIWHSHSWCSLPDADCSSRGWYWWSRKPLNIELRNSSLRRTRPPPRCLSSKLALFIRMIRHPDLQNPRVWTPCLYIMLSAWCIHIYSLTLYSVIMLTCVVVCRWMEKIITVHARSIQTQDTSGQTRCRG